MILDFHRITGVMVQYYKACKRELWLFTHQINLNVESEYIALGKLVHEQSYDGREKNILLDDTISFDMLRKQGDTTVIEIRKSSKLEEPAKYQLLYYLFYLKQKGVNAKGEIVYPKERKKEEILLTEKVENELLTILQNIKKIIQLPTPPKIIKKPYCRRCSYFEFCFS